MLLIDGYPWAATAFRWRQPGGGLKESLAFQCVQHALRHGFVVLARVADVGKHLGQSLLLVDFHEVLVLGQGLFGPVAIVDTLGRIVLVGLFMNDCTQGQPVALGRGFVGPT